MSSASPVQTGRLLTLTTPLGGDVLIGTALSGTEGLSQLFRFTLSMVSANAAISPDALLGKPVTVKIARPGGAARSLNGIVTAFRAGDRFVDGMRRYEAVLEPKLWLLTRTADCRIFQNQSVIQIAEALLSDSGVSDYKKQGLSGSHPARDYCVQYRETDYDFLQRILAEEGVYFYFQHEAGKHTLVLSDSTGGYVDCLDKSVNHAPPTSAETVSVHEWSSGFHFQSGKTTLRDYDFEHPTTDLTASTSTVLPNPGFSNWEVFDYPGDYLTKEAGTSLSRTRMEAQETLYAIVHGAATYAGFSAGAKFTMAQHEVAGERGKSHVLATVAHEAQDLSHIGNQAAETFYRNSFTAMPATVAYRPPPVTRRPLIPGPQTALVVGPSGEEIYCDKYGRIRVQFHWDRRGKKDENSSCWVRVAQSLAGAGWGAQFIPRVGMEVVVVFLEGDPDRPLVVGSVYNSQNMPPYAMPDNKSQSGVKTRSTAQGSASTFNELRFEDKKEKELVYMRAQKDFTRDVENDDTLTVKHDQVVTITHDRTQTIQDGNDSLTVSKGNRSAVISKGDDTLTVSGGSVTTSVASGDHTVKLGSGNATLQCDGGSITLKAAQSITLKVGGNSLTISQSGMSLKATQITISGDAKVQVSGPMVKIDGNGTVQIQGGIVTLN